MDFYEAMGWIALCLNVLGNLDLANKSIRGWIIRLACNVTFILYSYDYAAWPLLVNHIIFMFVNVYGFYKWTVTGTVNCSCGRKYGVNRLGHLCVCELPIRK